MDAPTDQLAIFPLPAVVLFPETRVPLHLFEPRYRQMARDVLAGSRRIGMVSVLPEHVEALAADPPVFPIGCEGKIERAEEQPDGCFDIVLTGTNRFRILEEPPRPAERLYRSARVERMIDRDGDLSRIAERRAEIIELVGRLLEQVAPKRTDWFSPGAFGEVSDRSLVNGFAQSLDFGVLEKLTLLEANSVSDRCAALEDLLRFRLAEITTCGGSQPGPVH